MAQAPAPAAADRPRFRPLIEARGWPGAVCRLPGTGKAPGATRSPPAPSLSVRWRGQADIPPAPPRPGPAGGTPPPPPGVPSERGWHLPQPSSRRPAWLRARPRPPPAARTPATPAAAAAAAAPLGRQGAGPSRRHLGAGRSPRRHLGEGQGPAGRGGSAAAGVGAGTRLFCQLPSPGVDEKSPPARRGAPPLLPTHPLLAVPQRPAQIWPPRGPVWAEEAVPHTNMAAWATTVAGRGHASY